MTTVHLRIIGTLCAMLVLLGMFLTFCVATGIVVPVGTHPAPVEPRMALPGLLIVSYGMARYIVEAFYLRKAYIKPLGS